MSLLDAHAETAGAAYDRQLRDPGPAPEIGFNMSSFIGAGLKAIPAAAMEVTASFQEMVGAAEAGNYERARSLNEYNASRGRSVPDEDQMARRKEVADMLQAAGYATRRQAMELSPDPITSHLSDQVIHGLARLGGKTMAAVGVMGPVGVLPLGLEEGNTATQNLRQAGVDTVTATKVGAVQGALAAAGAVVPLAGKTILQTLGLVGIGGPGSFMVQEQLSKDILARAGYADEASLHNPFDPLGLALSTVIPGAFGALHMRSINAPKLVDVVKHIESGGNPDAVGPNIPGQGTAKGEMQVMDATNTDPGFGVVPAKDNSPEERARVGRDYLGAMVTRYGDQDKALAAYNAGPGKVDAAIKEHGDGWLATMPAETQKYVAKARKLTGDYAASEGAKSPEVVDAARVSALNETITRSLPDHPEAYADVMRASDIVAESGGRAAEPQVPDRPEILRMEDELRVIEEQMSAARPAERPVASPAGQLSVERETAAFAAARQEFYDASQKTGPLSGEGLVGEPLIDAAIVVGRGLKNLVAGQSGAVRSADRAFLGLKMRAAELRLHIAQERATATIRQEASPRREAYNALPEQHSVTLAGDEPATPGVEMGPRHRAAGRQPSQGTDVGTFDVQGTRLAEVNLDVHVPPSPAPVLPPAARPLPASDFEVTTQGPDGRSIKTLIRRVVPKDDEVKEIPNPQAADLERAASNAPAPATHSVRVAVDESATRGVEPRYARAPADQAGPARDSVVHAMAQKIAAEAPDLKVAYPGTDEQLTVAQALARIAEEHKQDGQWADLVRVAAECALSGA